MITGVLYQMFATETHRDFRSRKFWVQELNVKYPNVWELIFWHDDCESLDQFKVGMIVECEFKVWGRIWEDRDKVRKIKTTLQCVSMKQV